MSDEVQSMFSFRNPPWHGKGVVVNKTLTASEAIVAAGLDWGVYGADVEVGGVPLPGYMATVRDDTRDVLGIVSDRYSIVENKELFTFFDPVVEEGEAIYHTAGALLGGRVVWVLAKLGSGFWVEGVKDDRVDNYVLLASSHDGSLPIVIKSTPIRVVCWNTLGMSLLGLGTEVRLYHRPSIQYELKMAHKALGLATKRVNALRGIAGKLASVQVDSALLKRFLRKVLPSGPEKRGDKTSAQTKKKRERVEMLWLGSDTNNLPGMRGTAWGLLNSYIEYVDHEWPTRGGTDRLNRTWFGSGADAKQKAINILLREVRDK